jgi:hypothetical protein
MDTRHLAVGFEMCVDHIGNQHSMRLHRAFVPKAQVFDRAPAIRPLKMLRRRPCLRIRLPGRNDEVEMGLLLRPVQRLGIMKAHGDRQEVPRNGLDQIMHQGRVLLDRQLLR